MFECSLDARVVFVKKLDAARAMVAVQPIGVPLKGKSGEKSLRLYVNAFFPTTFRGVLDLRQGDLVRISARLTGIDELEDQQGKNTVIVRMALHGYSIVHALEQAPRTNVPEEMGAA